ncbi:MULTISPECIES: bifunctional phosphopantothenoylcysteine decarboxylase/phosphopantothenate--cysteine ligase CoaBC [unclassified Clostridium]|uniref:bifunctional phosphopantothenoylcysteine decarboxylase/phosphopantothenate--cysteine ligase CoaBC n=1 Tax=unclassified Clostridium TaxID=2614128 RepID=UPI0002D2EEC1|nr:MULTISPECIES: bifunctional phosphopantothenoylcysteine decarboxylase/phosphopantothenate--cysteine ligase CoaBC [unclassified Clostridium]MBN1051565.1 bifunctional phosphopantothenoylcysteine decarboxylase/phosphopantothenate--cysteine ligase CoaBC [Clostridium botulinum]MBN1054793.1 bifunctional phosphopantothenoylcysteine decarboxylase/phosphopantothenate--cysteine ligase CoaBC [Clostridium botulinum]NFR87062.1 bifunctional phosphopantothenoylcysteine decarboxylase/phosphopantothenate--cyst
MKKCVVLGVSGGIAVYKALEIVSLLRKQDIEVRVIMTKSATEFVTPLSFQSLSQNMVIYNMFSEPKAWEIQHISLAEKADVFLVAPATANIIGKVANGIADDMLSTTIMATKAKVIFAPAMNTHMYENPIVQANIEKLKTLGYEFIEPASGRLACGDIGKGKLEDPKVIVDRVISQFTKKDLVNKNILVTAGPTISPIDPVRYITNRSTGKMGYSIAKEARDRGANVTLISGPTSLEVPANINFIRVSTNSEMKEEVNKYFDNSDVVIKSAAVADYKAKEYSNQKIKKGEGDLELAFTRDNDILMELGRKKKNQILVGFAAESQNLKENAKRKLMNKNLDYIVANDITSEDTGFASEDNRVIILSNKDEEIPIDKTSKNEIASKLFDIIGKR